MLNFSAEADPRRESISNVGNLKKGSCHRSYTLGRNGLNGLSFDSQSSESGSIKRERRGGLLMHASIPTVYFLSCFPSNLSSFSFVSIFVSIFVFVLFCFVFFFFLVFFLVFLCFLLLVFFPSFFFIIVHGYPLYTVCHCGIYPFCTSIVFGSLWASL